MSESDQGLRKIVVSLYVPTLLMSFCGALVVPVLPLLALSFDVSYGITGVVLAAPGIGTLICDMPVGTLVRRIGYVTTADIYAAAIVAMSAALAEPARISGLVLVGTASQCNAKIAAWYERIAVAGEEQGLEGLAQAIYGERSRKRDIEN